MTVKSSEPHPTYTNPTVNEAICDIHFTIPEGLSWNSSYYSKYFTLIQGEYSLFEPVFDSGAPVFDKSSTKMRFYHDKRNHYIQLSELALTINELQPYLGWQIMQTDILNAWGVHREAIGPVQIDAVSLRYVNFILAENEHQKLGEWLEKNPYVADSVLTMQPSFSQVLSTTQKGTRLLINTGEIKSPPEDGERTFVLDINAMYMVDEGSQIEISAVINQLHNEVWEIFNGFKSDKLDGLLNEEVN